ncbi:MAG: hypothetical protein Q9217_003099 [Psora testacea]
MDFHDIFSALKPAEVPGGKATTNITQIPTNIVEAFIPGYSIISKLLYEYLGFDVSLMVTGSLLIFGLIGTSIFLCKNISVYFKDQVTSSISIRSDDDIYDHVMEWLAKQHISKTCRSLTAKTSHGHTWGSENGHNEEDGLDADHLLNFSNWDAKVPPTFQPSFGYHIFWHCGRMFQFSRKSTKMQSLLLQLSSQDETIEFRCIGRSTDPIKNLIKECSDDYLDKGKSGTVVRRPAPKEHRDRGRQPWIKVTTRPSRPIDTVVLDQTQKDCLIRDINEYLHPATARWYANRVRVYSRDKSVIKAIIFGPRITEALSEEPRTNRPGITLSGLLNTIDGVASHEGRVLVITSNFPQTLDEALIRPGRIDMQVEFTHATRPQIREIFIRMYSLDTASIPHQALDRPANKLNYSTGDPALGNTATSEINTEEFAAPLPHLQSLTIPTNLQEIATEFATLFEEGTFTPAEIQGFLLTQKKDPIKALKEGPAWRDQVLKAKKSKMGPMQRVTQTMT